MTQALVGKMAPVLVLLLTLLIASIILFLFFKSRSRKAKILFFQLLLIHPCLEPVKGNTIIICGPVGSGKTSLFLKVNKGLLALPNYSSVL